MVQSAAKILGLAGHRCDGAENVKEALALLERESYDLVLTDLMLPVLSGYDVLETMEREYPAIPRIMITGYATQDAAVDSLARGAFDFVPKPFDIEELLSSVSRALAFRRLGDPEEVLVRWKRTRLQKNRDEKFHFLGTHSWVVLEPDGTGRVGVAEGFPGCIQPLKAISADPDQKELRQGDLAVTLVGQNEHYPVWAPCSGRIVERNPLLTEDSNVLNTDPFFDGWLFRMIPSAPEEELRKLIVR